MNCAKSGCESQATGKSKYCDVHKKEARAKWLEMIREKANGKDEKEACFKKIWAEALAAGREAGERHLPRAMVLEMHSKILDDTSPVVERYVVPQGICGFAWVRISPATCSFARWLKKNEQCGIGYYGGLEYHVREYGQSFEKKLAAAEAIAGVLITHGISAHADSRLD